MKLEETNELETTEIETTEPNLKPDAFTLGMTERAMLADLKQLTGRNRSSLVREAIKDLYDKLTRDLGSTHDAVIVEDD